MAQAHARNPFALLTNPEVVVQAMEASERLGRLRSRVCRPLDRPLDRPPGSTVEATDDDGSAADAEASGNGSAGDDDAN
jgi:hypothetical protein